MVTLYHWDLPQELEDAGGWTNRDTAARFADYAAAVAARLGDRVRTWFTLNEPWCSAFLGYGQRRPRTGPDRPGGWLVATHHLLLGHGLAAQALRANAPTGQVSIAINAGSVRPVTDAPADVDAARRIDGLLNRSSSTRSWWPLPGRRHRRTPPGPLGLVIRPQWRPMSTIAAPLDVLGVNYYQPDLVGAASNPAASTPYPGCEDIAFHQPPGPRTGMGWTVDPSGLRDVLLRVHRDYAGSVALPLMVTENGAAYDDVVGPDGAVDDPDRVEYLHQHLAAVHEAITAGVDVRGYFVWSLLDNFEWAYGLSKRFGLIHVDYATLHRTLKTSAHWYQQVIATGGLPPR